MNRLWLAGVRQVLMAEPERPVTTRFITLLMDALLTEESVPMRELADALIARQPGHPHFGQHE